jgi:FdhE protein
MTPGGRSKNARFPMPRNMSTDSVGFLAAAAPRPALERYLSSCRCHLPPGVWPLGVCPFCGAPPAFADLLEDGRRQLACHVCDGRWTFARLACPFCGTQKAQDMARLVPESSDEGYALAVCKACGGYVKELDRRLRWNAGPALVEDWGTPHLDLAARRAGYWRAVPILIAPGSTA